MPIATVFYLAVLVALMVWGTLMLMKKEYCIRLNKYWYLYGLLYPVWVSLFEPAFVDGKKFYLRGWRKNFIGIFLIAIGGYAFMQALNIV